MLFLERVRWRALVADGALGTMLLASRGRFQGCLEEWNLSEPERVRRVHREYVQSGAEIVETNTFGANRVRLREHGLEDRVEAINRAGVEGARAEAGGAVLVAGAVGPLGARLGTEQPEEEARRAFREQIGALVAAGVDLILLETFCDPVELVLAVTEARRAAGPEVPLAAQATVGEDGRLPGADESLDSLFRSLTRWGAHIVGCNCSTGPESTLRAVASLSRMPAVLGLQPSAGLPQETNGEKEYPSTPQDFGAWGEQALALGVRMVGGCCGTTPDHIRSLRAVAGRWRAREQGSSPPSTPQDAG